MAEWTRLCSVGEAPAPSEVREVDAAGRTFCLANLRGELHVLDNICPHREGPLGQGWIEGDTVVCPWHAWAFNCTTGIADPPEHAEVKIYPVRQEAGEVQVDLA